MRYNDDRHHLQIDLETVDCQVPEDERAHLQQAFSAVGQAVAELNGAQLQLKAIHHESDPPYHVEGSLALPGATLFANWYANDLDTGFQQTIDQLIGQVDDYKREPHRQEQERAAALEHQDEARVAPTDRDTGPLGEAAAKNDYQAFFRALGSFEDWLRKRIGRWIQRYPDVEARLGRDIAMGDILENVLLAAFERFDQWPDEVPFSDWLDKLIDPVLRDVAADPTEAAQNASFARTLRAGSAETR